MFNIQYVDRKKIIITGDYYLDCSYDVVMKNTFGLNKVPDKDKSFGEFILVNDTLLKVNYYFPEWVEKFNKHRKAKLFPSQLILDPRIFD